MANYELLDDEARMEGRRYRRGDVLEIEDTEHAERLEAMGSVRPEGTDDHDLVDDERDLPGILASPRGRQELARKRMAKRSKGGRNGEQAKQQQAQASGPQAGPQEQAQATASEDRGREKSPGRRA